MKRIVIIGGSSGIGKATALKLFEEGHDVFITYNTSSIVELPETIQSNKLDVNQDELNFDFLPDQIDGLVFAPGSIILKPFQRISPEEFMADYQLQLVGAVKTIQALLPRLQKSDRASVVLFSTVAVQKGFPFHALVASSKGAVEGLSRSLAAEFAPGIRVNCIAPSLTDTPMAANLLSNEKRREVNAERHPLKRIGMPEDIAAAAAFLINDDSDWMSGQVLHIDGGISTLIK